MSDNLDAGAIIAAIRGRLMSIGLFDTVNGHEPISSPGTGTHASVYLGPIRPSDRSGLSSTSLVILIMVRLWISAQAENRDDTEIKLATATSQSFGALIAGFQLADASGVPTACAIDIRGMAGTRMEATPGYASFDGTEFRVQTITVPVLVENVWDESP